MRLVPALPLLLILLTPATTLADYRQIELKIFGMDCATCAHGIRVAVQRVAGVESVELSLKSASASIRLAPDNRVSLDQLRQIVKRNGFKPREAIVTAVGEAGHADGKLIFTVSAVNGRLTISPKSDAAALGAIKDAISTKRPAGFEIVGTVHLLADGSDEVTIARAAAR